MKRIHKRKPHYFFVGDDPPRDRTGELRVLGFPGRHLGPVQMTTDTALGVTKIVVEDKGKRRVVYAFLQRILNNLRSQLNWVTSNSS